MFVSRNGDFGMGRLEYLIMTASRCRKAADEVLKALPGSDIAEKLLELATQLEADAKAMADGPALRPHSDAQGR